jgi:hypothetical protein
MVVVPPLIWHMGPKKNAIEENHLSHPIFWGLGKIQRGCRMVVTEHDYTK